jgi:UDP-2-acetamido-3-amino-2,3-dideoxy-glucuronate N-acetyltransferase
MAMRGLVIGMGEVGQALFNILKATYPDTQSDDKKWETFITLPIDIVHICIPHTEDFIEIVSDYEARFAPKYLVIHSSVPVGTTAKIAKIAKCKVYYSPIRGHHANMEQELRVYVKYIASDSDVTDTVSKYFEGAGISTEMMSDTMSVELMKLLELYRYGLYIAGAKEQEKICDHFHKLYGIVVTQFEETSNAGLISLGKAQQCQPILWPFKDYVGGHCTVEDMDILLRQVDMPLLKEAYKIDRGTIIWPNCNIYPGAKIGKGCSIGQFCEIDEGVTIGNNVRIGAFTFIPGGVTIEDNCFIAPRVSFSNDKRPPSKKDKWGKILIKKGAMIGMGSIVLPGVTVGENAVVGAGAVVTKDIPDGEIWYGQAAYKHGMKNELY